jgi:hypothetical protein
VQKINARGATRSIVITTRKRLNGLVVQKINARGATRSSVISPQQTLSGCMDLQYVAKINARGATRSRVISPKETSSGCMDLWCKKLTPEAPPRAVLLAQKIINLTVLTCVEALPGAVLLTQKKLCVNTIYS